MPMTPDEQEEELRKCLESPYYFATTYLTITNEYGKTVKYETHLTEEEYNNQFKKTK